MPESIKSIRRDLEESEELLDAEEGQPVDFWEKKQKELVLSVVDYNLGTLADLVSSNTIDLSPRYQRRFRWDNTRKSKLIESFLMNVPVPPIFLNEDQYGQYSVIDGKQRLTSITEFFKGKFKLTGLKVFSDINGYCFDDLPSKLQSVIRTRPTLRAVIILRQSDEDVKFEVFQRLNTGGVRANPQEIRNSTYPGPFNDLLLGLSVETRFHSILGIKFRNRSSIYQEMRDVEFVLRFFTFRECWHDFKGGSMKNLMDHYMRDNQKLGESEIRQLSDIFLATISKVNMCFGEYSFRRWEPARNRWRRQVLAALYDAQMFACDGFEEASLEGKGEEAIIRMKELFQDEDFLKAISAATNNVGNFRARITKVKDMLRSVTG